MPRGSRLRLSPIRPEQKCQIFPDLWGNSAEAERESAGHIVRVIESIVLCLNSENKRTVRELKPRQLRAVLNLSR